MGTPFIGEVRMFGGSFAPAGWAFCSGQIMSIAENSALFALIGTTYGGDGQETFALPDLRGRIPVGVGPSYVQGQKAGEESHTLTTNEIAAHSHLVNACSQATTNVATGNLYAGGGLAAYRTTAATTMNAAVVRPAGGGQPHDNMMPFLVCSFIISLFGIFPSRN
jgi:microcystin-dependent protein